MQRVLGGEEEANPARGDLPCPFSRMRLSVGEVSCCSDASKIVSTPGSGFDAEGGGGQAHEHHLRPDQDLG